MSTFDGKVIEFPDIRIDYFRVAQKEVDRPLAFFLSHVHSDHLAGLETCKSPFIYCSPATREILLRLEKYPHRMNFAKGILEARKQTYRHLKNLLKPIPLATPTTIELAPGRHIRVTLFDANHCTGAVAFLIEDDKHAILYTGDVRSERWWVDSLVRHPLLLPFAALNGSPHRTLDCMYLDTTFASDQAQYKDFPSKQDGVTELLSTISQYSNDTIFYFNSWTFGYEDVWVALSAFLKSRIHVDDYRFGLYSALSQPRDPKPEDAHRLIGFYCGNHFQEGCITRTQTRLHSCEQGAGCGVFDQDYVRITPIISRYNGQDMPELGAGGGHGDLDQQHELELGDQATVQALILLCHDKLQESPHVMEAVVTLLHAFTGPSVSTIPLDANLLQRENGQSDHDIDTFYDLPIENLVPAIVKFVQEKQNSKQRETEGRRKPDLNARPDGLPKHITFPYSRHSSTNELCLLVNAFRPIEIYPCTVEASHWSWRESMQSLFGHLYPGDKTFRHDDHMRQRTKKRPLADEIFASGIVSKRRQLPSPAEPLLGSPFHTPEQAIDPGTVVRSKSFEEGRDKLTAIDSTTAAPQEVEIEVTSTDRTVVNTGEEATTRQEIVKDAFRTNVSQDKVKHALRREAFEAALGRGELRWHDLSLISTRACVKEKEL